MTSASNSVSDSASDSTAESTSAESTSAVAAPVSDTKPPLSLLGAVALLSAAVLGFEVALTRVFAVLLRYHFAFLSISIAVCGLGVGGYAVHWLRRRYVIRLPLLCIAFAVAVVASLVFLLRGLFAYFPDQYWLTAVAVLVPFTLAGAVLAEAFARYPAWSGRLYAWDLAGAALAAVGSVAVLQFISAIDACLLAALLGALAALGFGTHETAGRRWLYYVAPVLLLALLVANVQRPVLDVPPVPPRYDQSQASVADRGITQPLFTELGTPGNTSRLIETRWNAFARTDVVQDAALPNSFYLYTNGNVPTNMMQWDGDLAHIGPIADQFPLSDWIFAVAPLGGDNERSGDVFSIGPGGGLDALLALHHGARRFDGAEINPSIVELMNEPKYRQFNGGIYQRPEVRVQTAEGRAAVREAIVAGRRYDLVFSALTKTATASQGMALLESFVYTTDAFADYLKVLKDGGQVAVVLDNPVLLARFWATAMEVLQRDGINAQTAAGHTAIVFDPRPNSPYRYALLVQKEPFLREQSFPLENNALRRGLVPVWIPFQAARADFGPYPAVAEGDMTLDQFIAWFMTATEQPLVIAPLPDDRPFVLDLSPTTLPVFKQLTVFALVLGLALALLGWRGETAAMASLQGDGSTFTLARHALFLLYFLCLGLGFMLVEIPLSQQLILALGYPTLSLTVILFSVLLGGGAGAYFSQRFEAEKLRGWATICTLGVALMTAVLALWLLDAAKPALLTMSLPTRCLLTTLALLPLGFLLGTPFPSGLRLFAQRQPLQVPLVWGLNGVASVAGSLLAAMGAKNFGFTAMLLCGALAYALAAGVLLALRR